MCKSRNITGKLVPKFLLVNKKNRGVKRSLPSPSSQNAIVISKKCLMVVLLYPDISNFTFQNVKILKCKIFLINFLDELGNFKQKKFYTSKCKIFLPFKATAPLFVYSFINRNQIHFFICFSQTIKIPTKCMRSIVRAQVLS